MTPKAKGALCERCPLRDEPFVGGEWREDALAVLVGEAPGEQEVKIGRPFVGPAGMELKRNLEAVGLRRTQFSITNAILCHPPENRLAAIDGEVRRQRRKGNETILHPVEACRERLLLELRIDAVQRGTSNVVALGGAALQGITGGPGSILEVRGGPREIEVSASAAPAFAMRLLPTLHPAFVMRSRRWTQAFRADLARAARWFESGLSWKDPETRFRPSVAELRAFLTLPTPYFVYDVETAPAFPEYPLFQPERDFLRCIGLCTAEGDRAVVVPFRSIASTEFAFYTRDERREIAGVLRDFFAGGKPKAGHNSGYYDRMVIETALGITPKPHLDSIGLHKFADPELPHRLGYVGSVYTDVTSWKAGNVANEARTDMELWKYNSIDCAVTALAIPQLAKVVADRAQDDCYRFWHNVVQPACVGLHKNGMFVDQEKRRTWDEKLIGEAMDAKRTAQENAGFFPRASRSFNPGSADQLRDILFERWNLPVAEYTDSGEPSTNDASLRRLLAGSLDPAQRKLITAVRDYRYAVKLRGTYVTKLRPVGEPIRAEDLAWDDDESEEAREKRAKRLSASPGLVMPDGRVHPDYNAPGTVGWRLSSSSPNAQNTPRKIRDVIMGQYDRVIVGSDMDQLELRFAAALAGARRYLAAFESGGDPHAVTCEMLYGEQFTTAGADRRKALRDFAKRFSYAVLYGAEDETVHEVITSSEDEDGNLIYSNVSLRETSSLRRRWLDANPEIEQWWANEVAEWQRVGYLAEPVMKQRVDFLDGMGGRDKLESKLYNFRCQCIPGFTRVLTDGGYIPISELDGQRFRAWTGKRWASATAFQKGEAELYAIRTDRGLSLYADSTHSLLVAAKYRHEWRAIGKIQGLQRVALDRARPLAFGREGDPEEAFALGFWIAEGSATPEQHRDADVALAWANNDTKVLRRIGGWARRRGMKVSWDLARKCKKMTIYVGGALWLRSWGVDPRERSATKRVPEQIWRSSLSVRAAFLRGVLEGDGYYNDAAGHVTLHLCQKRLLEELWLLFRTVGVDGGRIDGPRVTDRNGHLAWTLALCAAQVFDHVGWTRLLRRPKMRTGVQVPWWVARDALRDELTATTRSDAVIKSRLAHSKNTTSPYVLARMGSDPFDYAVITSVGSRKVTVPVYTLSVDDPDHSYVAEGFISKNSGGAALVHLAMRDFLAEVPFEKWGPSTGLIQQGHDALEVEVPCAHEKYAGADAEYSYCPPKCACEANRVARILEATMKRDGRPYGLPVTFTASAKIRKRWYERKEKTI